MDIPEVIDGFTHETESNYAAIGNATPFSPSIEPEPAQRELVMFVIKCITTGRYLFGNKRFISPCTDTDSYRKFDSMMAAKSHIDEWFDNSDNEYVIEEA